MIKGERDISEPCLSRITLSRPPSCIQLFPQDKNAAAIGTYVLEENDIKSSESYNNTSNSSQKRTGSLDILHIKDDSL